MKILLDTTGSQCIIVLSEFDEHANAEPQLAWARRFRVLTDARLKRAINRVTSSGKPPTVRLFLVNMAPPNDVLAWVLERIRSFTATVPTVTYNPPLDVSPQPDDAAGPSGQAADDGQDHADPDDAAADQGQFDLEGRLTDIDPSDPGYNDAIAASHRAQAAQAPPAPSGAELAELGQREYLGPVTHAPREQDYDEPIRGVRISFGNTDVIIAEGPWEVLLDKDGVHITGW